MIKMFASVFLLLSIVVVSACSPTANPQTPFLQGVNTPVPQNVAKVTATPTETPQDTNPLDAAVAGLGGAAALDGLSSLVIASSVVRRARGEGRQPDFQPGPPIMMNLISTNDVAGDNLRLDFVREGQNTQSYSEILAGNLGYMVGTDANFGGGDGSNISSDRWASSRQHNRLTNPHLILRDALADASMVSNGGLGEIDGVEHRLLIVEDRVAPITLYVNSETGTIAKLQTMENDHWLRDVTLEVFYASWQATDGSLLIPNKVSISIDGETMYQETRSNVQVNAPLSKDTFEFPESADPVFDTELATHGEATSQAIQMFSARGFPQRVLQTSIDAREIAPGIFHLGGSSHNSLAIVQANGIVIAEAPLYPERSEAIIDWVERQFPDKPITHVIVSHHHRDHSSGLRAFVARKITVVLSDQTVEIFREIFSGPSTIMPDALAENPTVPIFEPVAVDGMFEIPDIELPVTVFAITPNHASDTLFTYVGGGNVIFMGDGGQQTPELRATLEDQGVSVSWYAGGHGPASAAE